MPSKIEWCDDTWNPMTGCTPISAGCENCYAKRMANRLRGRFGYPKDDPFKVTFHPDRLNQPLKWKKPKQIFVCSMGDLFHEDVSFDEVAAIFGIAAFCQDHIFLFLTKRPERATEFFNRFHGGDYLSNYNWWLNEACLKLPEKSTSGIRLRRKGNKFPLPNIWLGVTAENQQTVDERIPILLQIPAAVRFVSLEPMLEEISLASYLYLYEGIFYGDTRPKIGWIILGAETGPGARSMELKWARDVQAQCKAAGVPFFFKSAGKQETPDDLMVREFPK